MLWGLGMSPTANAQEAKGLVIKYGITFDDTDDEQLAMAVAMMEAAGYDNVVGFDDLHEFAPGLGIHEMGGARMGRDPKTSVLNKFNQVHTVNNVYVTDGACMTSAGCQNPSLTYMALTARAANHAVNEFKSKNKV